MNVKLGPDEIQPSFLSGPVSFMCWWMWNSGLTIWRWRNRFFFIQAPSDCSPFPTLSSTITKSHPKHVVDAFVFVDCLDSIRIKGCKNACESLHLSIRTTYSHFILPHSTRYSPTTPSSYPDQCRQLERPTLVCCLIHFRLQSYLSDVLLAVVKTIVSKATPTSRSHPDESSTLIMATKQHDPTF